MPAKSKSQQRLFGMVHAYQKGEFHGSRGLRNRIAGLAKHISKTDARHFAATPHKGLPEKTASEEYAFKGDRVTIFDNIRSRHAGKKATVISTNHNGADKARQVSVFKTDDGHVFSGYTAAYVATNHTSKAAELVLRPDQVQALVAQVPPFDYSRFAVPREEEKPKSLVGDALKGALLGTATGGALGSGLGGVLSYQATKGKPSGVRARELLKALVRCGFWGASRGAVTGTAVGAGLNVFNRMRS